VSSPDVRVETLFLFLSIAGVHKFSKNIGVIAKFYTPEW
jgi:hypothetical protein